MSIVRTVSIGQKIKGFFSKYVSNFYLQTMHKGGLEEENALGQKIGLKKQL